MKKIILIMLSMYLLVSCASYKDDYEKTEALPKESGVYKMVEANDMAFMPIQEEFNTEEYDKINENNFLYTKDEPLSTFSIDVDTASYSNFKRFISNNQLPPIDSIRIEEFINYFNYDYPNPKTDKFSITSELSDCYWNENHQLLKVGLKGKELDKQKIPDSNIVFLIDVSGSMSDDNKLPLLKRSFKILLEKLTKKDKVSIVVYAGNSGVVLDSISGDKKSQIIAAFDKLSAGGSTAGGEGIKLAYKLAKQNFIKDGNNRVILATDGDFNVGQSSDAELERLIETKRNDGIFLTVLGFGMVNYKDSKMEKLSNAGNGNYAYINDLMEAKKVLGEEFYGTIFTIAKDVKIQIEFNPGKVKAYRLIGYENRMLNKEDFNNDKKDAGEVGAGHTITAFYEIIPSDSDEELTNNVDDLEYQTKPEVIASDNYMTFKLRYKEPDEDESKVILKRFTEEELYSKVPSQDFQFASSVIEFGLLLRESKYKENASIDHLLERARANKGLDYNGERAEFIRFVENSNLIKKLD